MRSEFERTVTDYILKALSKSDAESRPIREKEPFQFYVDIRPLQPIISSVAGDDALEEAIRQLRGAFEHFPLAWSIWRSALTFHSDEAMDKSIKSSSVPNLKPTLSVDILRRTIVATACPQDWYLTIKQPMSTQFSLAEEMHVGCILSRQPISSESYKIQLPGSDSFSICLGYSPGDFVVERPREILSKYDLSALTVVEKAFTLKPVRRGYSTYSLRIEDDTGYVFLGQEFEKTVPISPVPELLPPPHPPDLVLEIEQRGDVLWFKIWLPHQTAEARIIKSPNPMSLQSRTYLGQLKDRFDKLAKIGHKLPYTQTKRELELFGMFMYDQLVPKELQDFYWTKVVNHEINSVLIVTDMLDVPWEIVKPYRGSNERPFFCEQFELTRWLPNYALPPLDLRIFPLALVANPKGLSGVQTERTSLLARFADMIREIEPDWDILQALFHSPNMNGCCGLHLAGHGSEDEFRLKEGASLSHKALIGKTAVFAETRPFVFLNFCKAADTPVVTLTKIDSWTTRFITQAKAHCIIGPMWAANDKTAARFSEVVYDELSGLNNERKPKLLGEAVRQARQAIANSGDATWLSYTVYGHPLARLFNFPLVDGLQTKRRRENNGF